MNYRIKKYKEGYVVEIRKSKWYGLKYWTRFISVSGLNSLPWFHSTYVDAEMSLLNEIKIQTIKNSMNEKPTFE